MQSAKRRARRIGCAGIVSLAGAAAAWGQASIQDLGAPAGGTSQAFAVSGDGTTVVGLQTTVVNPGPPPIRQYEAFRWTSGGGRVGLGDLPGGNFDSRAFGVNGNGSVVVGSSVSGNGSEAFMWTSAGMTPMGDLGGGAFGSSANGISTNGGVIVGFGASAAAAIEAFRWNNIKGMVGLGDLPGGIVSSSAGGVSGDGGTIVGSSISANGTEAFRWTASGGMVGLGDLPGGAFNSSAAAANATGAAIVGSATDATGQVAVRWSSGQIAALGPLPAGFTMSSATAVSGDGDTVVGTLGGPSGPRAFVWTAAAGYRDLQAYLASLGVNMTGWSLDAATGISADGSVIVGYGQSPTLTQTAWRATIPAPCYVNCNSSTMLPVLNVDDFVCFSQRFAAGDPYADCNHTGVLNVDDYVCFTQRFAAGCP